MIELHPSSKQFIDDLQQYSGRTLAFPQEIGFLVDQTRERGMEQLFLDVIFHAKFATKTKEVMSRIGPGVDGYDKLSVEFQTSIEKVSTLLKTIVKESSDEIKRHFVEDFFSLDQASFSRFTGLLEDLSWVKNWEVDGKSLPISKTSLKTAGPVERVAPSIKDGAKQSENVPRIRNGALLGIVLMLLLFFVDPPVTFLGWGLAIVVVLMLLYISMATHAMISTKKKSI
jgi:hypothetical protein